MKNKILVIDDEEIIRKRLGKLLVLDGYEVFTAESGEQGLNIFQRIKEKKQDPIKVALVDVKMPKMDGIEVIEEIKKSIPQTEVIIITGHGSIESAIQALRMGAFDYVTKPIEYDELTLSISRALERQDIIRKREQAEEALKTSRASLYSIAEKSADGIIVVDRKGTIRFINRTAEVLFRRKKEELIDKLFGYPAATGEVTELDIIRKGGEARIGEMRVVQTEWERKVAHLVSIRDITERKEVEQMKSDFVSLVSHQLKTPIAEIKGYIENMLAGLTDELTVKQKEYLQEMYKISSMNYHLISDLLNISRIERRVIAVDIQSIKLKEIIDLALRDYRKSIKEKELALNLEEIDDEIMVLADKDKMTEALKNVVDNAVKFTDKGSITIRIKSEESFAGVEVVDTGKGISPDLLNKLFTKEQILSGSPITDSVCGLGLYIAKEFMKLQYGDISATSVVGKGSSFIFKVPLEREEEREWRGGEKREMNKSKKGTILLVEDKAGFRRIYHDILVNDGYEALEAEDGEAGWELAKEKKPDLILLDLVLPKLNGFEVLKRIRAHKQTKEIPVIILSVLGEQKDIQKGLELGANDYTVKGLYSSREILRKISAFCVSKV